MFKLFLYSFICLAVLAEDTTVEPTVPATDATTEPTTSTTSTTTTTSTSTTTSTTTSAPVTTPTPVGPSYFNVSKNGAYCIMVDGEFSFTVTYDIGNQKTNETTVMVPKPDSPDVVVTGNCDGLSTQWMNVSWGSESVKNSLLFTFNSTSNGTKWTLGSLDTVIVFNSEFINATKAGSFVMSKYTNLMSPKEVSYNESYKCFTELVNSTAAATMDDQNYTLPLKFEMNSAQVQAFNSIPDRETFTKATFCEADKIADIVPIAVGCALAALVLIVIIAYLVGRRRRSAAYQSV